MKHIYPICDLTYPKLSLLPFPSVPQERKVSLLTLPLLLRRIGMMLVVLFAFGILLKGQTTFALTLGANANWTTAGWVKTGTATAATYPGQVGGETHIVVINGTVASTLTLDVSITQSVSDVSIIIAGGTPTLSIGGNTLTMTGNLTGDGTLTFGTGNLNIGGNNTHTGVFTVGTGTVNYYGAAQQVRGTTYNNLTIAGSGNKTLQGSVIVGETAAFT